MGARQTGCDSELVSLRIKRMLSTGPFTNSKNLLAQERQSLPGQKERFFKMSKHNTEKNLNISNIDGDLYPAIYINIHVCVTSRMSLEWRLRKPGLCYSEPRLETDC